MIENGGNNGVWSDQVPTCAKILCPKLDDLQNGVRNCTDSNALDSECT